MHRIKENLQFKKTSAGESGSALSMPLPDPGACHSDPVGASYMTYQEQLKSPKWQKKRLEIMERDGFTCRFCGDKDSELHIHHVFYSKNSKIWEYNNKALITLCKSCHDSIHFANCDALIITMLLVERYGFDSFRGLIKRSAKKLEK